MKVAFDQNVPPALAKVFIALAKERAIKRISGDLILQLANQYAPKSTDKDHVKKSDVPWLDRFAAAGGRAIISGDVKIREKPHERIVLYEHGFVTIFFERKWSTWSSVKRTAILLHWWEEVVDKIKNAESGTFWVIPSSWPEKKGELRNVSMGLAQLLKDNPKAAKSKKGRVKNSGKRKQNVKPVAGQITLFTEQSNADEQTD